MSKKAILAVSFGTTYIDSLEKSISAVEKRFTADFPDYDVKRAFTSNIVRKKLLVNYGMKINSVSEALEELKNQGYEEIICQPTHIINGEEYDKMCKMIDDYRDKDKFKSVIIGRPLISLSNDYNLLIDALDREKAIDKNSGTIYLLMGHGTEHYSNAVYPALDYYLKAKGYNNVFVGTVEGFPEISNIIAQLDGQIEKIVIFPLMLVAGDHAINDMAGDDEDSWKSILERMGFNVECRIKGLGEYPSVQALYSNHIREVI